MTHDPRIRQDEAETGDGYLASVSDLMAGLVFFFLITLAVFALRLEVTRAQQQEKVDQWKGLEETRERILVDLKERMTALGLTVEVDPEQGILRLSDEGIFFPSGRAVPQLDYFVNVGKIAAALMEVVPCYVARVDAPLINGLSRPTWCLDSEAHSPAARCQPNENPWNIETLLIEGHTDSVPIRHSSREFKDNLQLSAARAAEVLRMIRQCEPGIDHLFNLSYQPVASVSGYAETRPVNAIDTESSENRRIDLRFMMEPPHTLLEDSSAIVREPEPATHVREHITR